MSSNQSLSVIPEFQRKSSQILASLISTRPELAIDDRQKHLLHSAIYLMRRFPHRTDSILEVLDLESPANSFLKNVGTTLKKLLSERGTENERVSKSDSTDVGESPSLLFSFLPDNWINARNDEKPNLDPNSGRTALPEIDGTLPVAVASRIARELSLVWWDETLSSSVFSGDLPTTTDLPSVINYFERREKKELIPVALQNIIESVLKINVLAEHMLSLPEVTSILDEKIVTDLRFRTRLHFHVDDQKCSREESARALINAGFDLVACDFNKCFDEETNYRGKAAPYTPNKKDTEWLNNFILSPKEAASAELAPEDSPKKRIRIPDGLATFAERVELTLKKIDCPYWVKTLPPLVEDHAEIAKPVKHVVPQEIQYHLLIDDLLDLAYELHRASATSGMANKLHYFEYVLKDPQHSVSLDGVLGKNLFARLVCGKLLIGHVSTALGFVNDEGLKAFHDESKLKAAVNLAWTVLTDPNAPGAEDGVINTPYLVSVAKLFGKYLVENPGATRYLKLVGAEKITDEDGLDDLIQQIKNPHRLRDVYTRAGRLAELPERYLGLISERIDSIYENAILGTSVAPLAELLSDTDFVAIVPHADIVAHMSKSFDDLLKKPNNEVAILAIAMYLHPKIKPYLEAKVVPEPTNPEQISLRSLVNQMLEDQTSRTKVNEILTVPLSINGSYEIEIFSQAFKAYLLALQLREHAEPANLQKLVSWLIATNLDSNRSRNLSESVDYLTKDKGAGGAGPYVVPEWLSQANTKKLIGFPTSEIELLNAIYRYESEHGGLNDSQLDMAITNVIFRGLAIDPNRFYFHSEYVQAFLSSPMAKHYPVKGLAADAMERHRVLYDFLGRDRHLGKEV